MQNIFVQMQKACKDLLTSYLFCIIIFFFFSHAFRPNAITLKWLGAVLSRRLTRSRLKDHVTLTISLKGQVMALREDNLKRQLMETRIGSENIERRENKGMK